MLKFPKCISFTINYNQHKVFYDDAATYITEQKLNIKSDSERAEMIDENEIWEIDWYPNTPVGSFQCAASTLEKLLQFAREINKSTEECE